jgi:hypothetical protein
LGVDKAAGGIAGRGLAGGMRKDDLHGSIVLEVPCLMNSFTEDLMLQVLSVSIVIPINLMKFTAA